VPPHHHRTRSKFVGGAGPFVLASPKSWIESRKRGLGGEGIAPFTPVLQYLPMLLLAKIGPCGPVT
jgi:hypothetical protein